MKVKIVERIPLPAEYKQLIGTPECRGSWFVWGDSGHGKSTFLMQLAKILSMYYKVDYVSLEEEDRASMQDLMAECKMAECRKGSFMLLPGYDLEAVNERISKPRSARIIIVDSVQYWNITTAEYKKLLADHPTKLFIFNSHADGKKPVGALGRNIKYDADVKLWVEGFRAFSRSRMSRGKITDAFTIWPEGAAKYWNNI